MRWSLVIASVDLSCGTLKSTRISTRLPRSGRSRSVLKAIGGPRQSSAELLRDPLRQLDDAVRVAPLVVVPRDELEEVLVELDRASRVEDRRRLVVDEV